MRTSTLPTRFAPVGHAGNELLLHAREADVRAVVALRLLELVQADHQHLREHQGICQLSETTLPSIMQIASLSFTRDTHSGIGRSGGLLRGSNACTKKHGDYQHWDASRG